MARTFLEQLAEHLTVLDGSTGTLLQQRGLPAGAAPEAFCLERPEVLAGIQTEYAQAGSQLLYTPTFGANRHKLSGYHLDERTREINRRLAEWTVRTARQYHIWAAGDMGPTGLFFEPFGEVPFEQGIQLFAEQAAALAEAGVDAFVIETQIDLQEARIALLAARSVSRLPVIVSMTFDESGRTLTGSDPLACLVTLQSLGAAAFGINCSTGPAPILEWVRELAPYAKIPLLVKPNAGLPEVRAGRTVFPMSPEEFGAFAEPFVEAGVRLIGGCCGTTPEHIRRAAQGVRGAGPRTVPERPGLFVASPRRAVGFGAGRPLRLIGERINPTGKKNLQAELSAGRLDLLQTYAQEQAAQGADLLDVNVSQPDVDEVALMRQAVAWLARSSELPVCLDSSRPEVLEAALRLYPGRVLLNSLSGERHKLDALLPLIQTYGPAFILLPLDDAGIPEDWETREAVLRRVLEALDHAGVPRDQAVIDGLALTVSANPEHAALTLRTLDHAAKTLGVNTVLGLSNISFGLPNRPLLNSAFLAMAAGHGLSAVIANPGDESLRQMRLACDVLTERDEHSRRYLQSQTAMTASAAPAAGPAPDTLQDLVIRGEKDRIEAALAKRLDAGEDPLRLLTEELFPAMETVGRRFQQREFFLPQLVAAAEAMERGTQFLGRRLEHAAPAKRGRVVLATVKGDVHDIGKKLVALMLRNHGYEVIDLGKSVDEKAIVDRAMAEQAQVIGLSALMTTTMTEMPKVIAEARLRCPQVKVIVGGAVVNQRFADEIGADGYAADSVRAVDLVNRLVPKPA